MSLTRGEDELTEVGGKRGGPRPAQGKWRASLNWLKYGRYARRRYARMQNAGMAKRGEDLAPTGDCVITVLVVAVYDRRSLFLNRSGVHSTPLQHKSRSCHADSTKGQRWLMRQMNLVDRQIEG